MSADGALDQLVHQFSDPLSFFRELIQNALDAGSPAIDVWFEYTPSDGGDGVMIIHVDDYGEGMDREIIDTRLTRLFSSAKDGDFTKIGRFGIGFVSVFAVAPEAVCVDTSRGGEHWRVLFEQDRSFTRIARDFPVDGTEIRIYKHIDEAGYQDFVARAEETVRFWCRHVEGAEIRFEDAPINAPVDLELPVVVRHEQPGTRVVAGYSLDGSSSYGFYNKGLTLLEGEDDAFLPGIHFKISSRYLEHTLTRDNVLRDAHFHTAMKLLKGQVEDQLPAALMAALDARLQADQPADDLYPLVIRLIAAQPSALRDRPLCRQLGGVVATVGEIVSAKARDHLYTAPADAAALAARVAEAHDAVILPEGDPILAHLSALPGGEPTAITARWCAAAPMTPAPEGWSELQRAVVALLDQHGAKVSEVALGRLTPISAPARPVAITQDRLWGLTPIAEAQILKTSFFSRRRPLVIDGDHETIRALLRLAPTAPALAAYCVVKLFFLGARLDPAMDAALAALE